LCFSRLLTVLRSLKTFRLLFRTDLDNYIATERIKVFVTFVGLVLLLDLQHFSSRVALAHRLNRRRTFLWNNRGKFERVGFWLLKIGHPARPRFALDVLYLLDLLSDHWRCSLGIRGPRLIALHE